VIGCNFAASSPIRSGERAVALDEVGHDGRVSASSALHDQPFVPDLNACREAARAVAATPCWPQVRDAVRPPGVGIHRSRPPLGLLLYGAARDGRLVWRSADEFALLEPPIARGREWASSDAGRTWSGRLDRWWDHLVFGVPPLLLLLLSVPTSFVPQVGPLLALLLVCVALLYIVAQMIFGLILRSVKRMRGTSDDSARGLHWTVVLFHLTDPAKADRLLRAALARSQHLTSANIRPDVAEGTHALMCLERAVTTVQARRAVAAAPSANGSGPDRPGVHVVLDGGGFVPPDPGAHRPISFIPLLLAGTALVVGVVGLLTAEAEAAACAAARDCADRPATWIDATTWLIYRMVLDDAGLTPATTQARIFGWLMLPLGLVVLLCLVVAGWRQASTFKKRQERTYAHLDTTINRRIRVLVLTVLDIERDAVISAVTATNSRQAEPDTLGGYPIFRLGRLGDQGTEVLLAQAAQGIVTPAAMMLTAERLIPVAQPDYVILAGICFGLWSRRHDGGTQELGDVVVSEYVQNVDHRKVTDEDGSERTIWRGERVQASTPLLLALKAATHGWTGRPIHFGTVLSGSTLVSSAPLRAELRREFEEASAGEMELTGVYVATAGRRSGWIMVKGISDWGTGQLTDDTRRRASEAAAAFMVHALTIGTLPVPSRGSP
jgi:nucleoside phosphorylase